MNVKDGDSVWEIAFMSIVTGAVLVLFGMSIYEANKYTASTVPKIIPYFASAVNGVLAANLGALLGIQVSLKGWRKPGSGGAVIQWIAAVFYVVALVIVAVLWHQRDFSDDAALLPEMTKNGIGILIALLAAALGVHTASVRAKVTETQNSVPGQQE